MSLAFCAYNLTVDVDVALKAFARIVDHLGLSHERVEVVAPERSPTTRIPLDRLGSLNSLFSGMPEFSFDVVSGEPLAATLYNAAPYICYQRTVNRDAMTVFSPRQENLPDFAQRFMGGVQGKYGFGMDWNRPGSFFGYAHGFDDFQSTGGDLTGISDAGRWGELYLQGGPTLFDDGLIRDIYPASLLTSSQLNRGTHKGTVRDLIRGRDDWGRITPLADNWFLWSVPPDLIDDVRREFNSRGLLKNSREASDGTKPVTL